MADSLAIRTHNKRNFQKWEERAQGHLAVSMCVAVNGPEGEIELMVSDEISQDVALGILREVLNILEQTTGGAKVIKGKIN